MFTIGNGLMGFASIYLATRQGVNGEPTQLALAAWLLFAAMFCDMIDGRLARFTRQTSDFGGQLDSMCDVISFGIAPPILMLRAVTGAAHEQVGKVFVFAQFSNIGLERLLWCLAAVYVAGAAMRLARFNVENVPDESAHMDFRGLPSPGAAAAVATLVLLFVHLQNITAGGWLFGPWLLSTNQRIAEAMAVVICVMLPLVTLATGLLMVSRFRYAHVVNQYIRGKRPFSYLVKLVVLGLLAVMEPYLALAGAAVVYAFSAPLTAAFLHLRRPPAAPAGPAAGPGATPT
jgi:CDP-diacylglycerol--serine O-phosphatidyltransferase